MNQNKLIFNTLCSSLGQSCLSATSQASPTFVACNDSVNIKTEPAMHAIGTVVCYPTTGAYY